MNERSASSTIVWAAQMRAPPSSSATDAEDCISTGRGGWGLRFMLHLGGVIAAIVCLIALAVTVKIDLHELENALRFEW